MTDPSARFKASHGVYTLRSLAETGWCFSSENLMKVVVYYRIIVDVVRIVIAILCADAIQDSDCLDESNTAESLA